MYYSSPSSLILSSSTLGLWMAGLVATETIVIEGGNLYFNPLNVNASVGDVLEFHFLPNNHSVVMGDLTDPCQPAAEGGFYSGFLPVSSGENVRLLFFFVFFVFSGRANGRGCCGCDEQANSSVCRRKSSRLPSTIRTRLCITAHRMLLTITVRNDDDDDDDDENEELFTIPPPPRAPCPSTFLNSCLIGASETSCLEAKPACLASTRPRSLLDTGDDLLTRRGFRTGSLPHADCKSGMFGFVNQANQSAIDAYTSGAKDSDVNISPDGDAFGGILAANSNTSASADSNSTSSSGGDNSTSSSTGTASGSGSATSASASASGTGIDSSGADREVAIRAGSAMLVALVMMMMVLVVA